MEEVVKRQHGYTGYLLWEGDREKLLERFPPFYPDVVAEHITVKFGVTSEEPLPTGKAGAIVGYANDYKGVEALVVEIDGNTMRPDGSRYHITWSLDRAAGAKPKDANKVISEHGFTLLQHAIPITLTPYFFHFNKTPNPTTAKAMQETDALLMGHKLIKETLEQAMEARPSGSGAEWYRDMIERIKLL